MIKLDEGELMVEAHGVSRFGLHRRHVIRFGERVSDRAIEEILERGASLAPQQGLAPQHELEPQHGLEPQQGLKILAVVRYVEEGLGLHHLRVYWRED